ncbi:MAG: hypothetical protein ACKPJO_11505 [Dolichospermum sp.]
MSHPIYSRQQLLNRGLVKVKKIAADLGVIPAGDKRLIQSWVDAITQYQSTQVQETKVEATIDCDTECYEGLTQPYVVLVDGVVVHRTTTYQQAVRHCQWQGYTLLDSRTLAQDELEAELEVQAESAIQVLEQVQDESFVKFVVVNHENGNHYTVTPAHPLPRERCECGDVHFRAANCKHQVAVRNFLASQVEVVSPTGFGYYEAVVGNINNVIGTIEYHSDRNCDQPWWNVRMAKETLTFTSYEEAEQFIKGKYVEDYLMSGRGSGRISEPIKDISMSIQDSNFVHDFGQSYTLRVNGVLAGSIFLDEFKGWTIDGESFQDDWRPVASQLVKLTRRELLAA